MTVHRRRAARARWLCEAGEKAPDLHARRASTAFIRMFAQELRRTRRQLRRMGLATRHLSGMDLWVERTHPGWVARGESR